MGVEKPLRSWRYRDDVMRLAKKEFGSMGTQHSTVTMLASVSDLNRRELSNHLVELACCAFFSARMQWTAYFSDLLARHELGQTEILVTAFANGYDATPLWVTVSDEDCTDVSFMRHAKKGYAPADQKLTQSDLYICVVAKDIGKPAEGGNQAG